MLRDVCLFPKKGNRTLLNQPITLNAQHTSWQIQNNIYSTKMFHMWKILRIPHHWAWKTLFYSPYVHEMVCGIYSSNHSHFCVNKLHVSFRMNLLMIIAICFAFQVYSTCYNSWYFSWMPLIIADAAVLFR